MLYLNVTRNNDFILSQDVKFSKNELINMTIQELRKSGVKDLKLIYENKQFSLGFNFQENNIILKMFLKNITGAGWEYKPEIKRCQVSNAKINNLDTEIIANHKYNLILGFYCFDSNPIFVAWDPYRYLHHNTLRSCYVTVDTLKRGYEKKSKKYL